MKGDFIWSRRRSGRSGAADSQGDPAAARVRCGRRTEVRRRQTDRTGYCFAVHRAGQVNPAVRYADDARQAGEKRQPRRGGRRALCAASTRGKTVVFLTLGDPTIYSTYWYVHKRVAARGYAAELVPGVPSFCAAATAMGRAPVRGTAKCCTSFRPRTAGQRACALRQQGADEDRKECIEVRELLRQRGELANAALIERVGMDGQRLIENLDELEQPSGYFSIILVKEQSE